MISSIILRLHLKPHPTRLAVSEAESMLQDSLQNPFALICLKLLSGINTFQMFRAKVSQMLNVLITERAVSYCAVLYTVAAYKKVYA